MLQISHIYPVHILSNYLIVKTLPMIFFLKLMKYFLIDFFLTYMGVADFDEALNNI